MIQSILVHRGFQFARLGACQAWLDRFAAGAVPHGVDGPQARGLGRSGRLGARGATLNHLLIDGILQRPAPSC